MEGIDILFLTLLGIGFVRGFIKGAIMQLASLAGIILGIYCAYHFYQPVSELLESVKVSQRIAVPLAYLIVFVAVAVAAYFGGKLFVSVSKLFALSWLDKLAGGIAGALIVALVTGVLLNLYVNASEKISGKANNAHDKSLLFNPLKQLPNTILPFIDFSTLNKNKTQENTGQKASQEP
jgi:membrane protein required for colicin V production